MPLVPRFDLPESAFALVRTGATVVAAFWIIFRGHQFLTERQVTSAILRPILSERRRVYWRPDQAIASSLAETRRAANCSGIP